MTTLNARPRSKVIRRIIPFGLVPFTLSPGEVASAYVFEQLL
jgi:hypothetical protein